MGRAFEVLTVDEIVEINRQMMSRFGGGLFVGDTNLRTPGSLEAVLLVIQGTLFGQDVYASTIEKAAALCWRIVEGHVFHDGNKRTGLEACRLTLEINGYSMRIDRDAVDMMLQIARQDVDFETFVKWVEHRTTANV